METRIQDIRLSAYDLDTMPRLKRMREKLVNTDAEVCIERARYVTRYFLNNKEDAEPMMIKYAKAVNHFLSNKEPIIEDDDLLAGTTTSKTFGAPVYPEWTGMTIWPELDTISGRDKNPLKLSKDEIDELNFEIYPYWLENNILEYTRKKNHNPDCMKLMERIVFFIGSKAGTISHTVPCYRNVLEQGLERLITQAAEYETGLVQESELSSDDVKKLQFYQATQIAMIGIINYAENLSRLAEKLAEKEADRDKRANFKKLSQICVRVPALPARNFREALNAIWIIQVAIHAENINMAMSPGRLDQVLYDYYRNDIEAGRLTVEEALELIGCFWLKLNDNTNLVPETAEELFGGAGTVPAVTVGGVDENGEDAVNDLTYLMLRITELLKTRDPSLNARYHYEKNSNTYRDRVAEVITNTRAVPAMHNDVVDIEVLKNQGTALAHARDYAVIGCVELASAGRSYDASSSIMLNLVSVLELTLYNGKRPVTGDEQITPPTGDPAGFNTFEEVWEAFKSQLTHVAGKAIELNEMFGQAYQEILPSPLLSVFMEGPMESGKDLIFGGALYNSSGATNIGFADTVDSFNAIEQAVFVDKRCTFQELLQAIQDDFEGHEPLHAYLINKTPKYGTDHPVARKNAQNLVKFIYDFYQSHVNYRGGKYRPGYWTMTNHAGQGKLSGALPNGRKANEVFASGITPVSQAASNLTACLRAVGNLDAMCIPSGEALNLKFPAITDEGDIQKLGQVVEAYFREGGLHIQFNIMSYEDLIKAKDNPDDYKDLLVRVSGYSAYFKELNEAMKEEIITRTAYDIKTGQIAPFPDEYKEMLSTE
jgi:formate C-acetyltransferase